MYRRRACAGLVLTVLLACGLVLWISYHVIPDWPSRSRVRQVRQAGTADRPGRRSGPDNVLGGVFRGDITGGGIGDVLRRIEMFLWEAVQMKAAGLAIHMGPCLNASNVFGELFDVPMHSDSRLYVTAFQNPTGAHDTLPWNSDRKYHALRGGSIAVKYADTMGWGDGLSLGPKLTSEHLGAACHGLVSSLRPPWRSRVESFKAAVGWTTSTRVIAMHIRLGSADPTLYDDNWFLVDRGKLVREQGMQLFLQSHLEHVATLAQKLNLGPDYKIYVATDNADAQQIMLQLAPGRVLVRDRVPIKNLPPGKPGPAHPLLYKNLIGKNGGDRCDLDWWGDPFVDLALLAAGDAVVSIVKSGFPFVAEAAMYYRGKTVCRGGRRKESPYQWGCFRQAVGVGGEEVFQLRARQAVALYPNQTDAWYACQNATQPPVGTPYPEVALCYFDQFELADTYLQVERYGRNDGTRRHQVDCRSRRPGSCEKPLRYPERIFLHGEIFLYGDSTMRQLLGAALRASPSLEGNYSFDELKEMVRNAETAECTPQAPHRKPFVSGGSLGVAKFARNEVTCSFSISPTVNITYDWKHFMWEDYDLYLFGPGGYFATLPQHQHPKMLVINFAHHPCSHTTGPTGTHNATLQAQFLAEVPTFMAAVNATFAGEAIVLLTSPPYDWGDHNTFFAARKVGLCAHSAQNPHLHTRNTHHDPPHPRSV